MGNVVAPEVNCFGLPEGKYRIERGKKITVSLTYPAKPEDFREYPVVMVYNDKLGTWQAEPMVECYERCPVCGKLMLVRAIAGTSWLACCSEGCYRKMGEKAEELGGLDKAIRHFMGKRGGT